MRRKHSVFLLLTLIVLITAPANTIHAQAVFKEKKCGHIYSISVPDFMDEASGLDDAASAQYQCKAKYAFTIVLDEGKAHLAVAGLKYSSIREYFDAAVKGWLSGANDLKISTPKTFKIGDISFIQVEATYYSPEVEAKIYRLKTIAETSDYFYQIISWTNEDNKDKLRDDLLKIPASLKEQPCK